MSETTGETHGAEPSVVDGSAAGSPRTCANCAAPLTGRYCAACGQDATPDAPFGHMIRELVDDVFNLDSRLWLTLKALLTRPGELSVEYRRGRRARYVSPTRLYLIASLVFFGAVALAPVRVVHVGGVEPAVEAGQVAGTASRGIEARLAEAAADPERLNDLFVRGLAWTMFVLIPVFALLLAGLYRASGTLYVLHLVFSLHFHAFGFLTQAAAYAAMHLPPGGAGVGVALLMAAHAANAGYLYLALRRFYGDPPALTLVKMTALGFAYIVAVSLGSMVTIGFVLLIF